MECDFTLIHLDRVDSTNRYALEHFDSIADRSLVSATSQTAGRGRRGKTWLSPVGNVYVSFVIKTLSFPLYHASWLGALALLDALREVASDCDLWLKWPNDVYCGVEKLAGLLCEVSTDKSNIPLGVVIGMGVNLNMPDDMLKKIDQPATSVREQTGNEINCEKFINVLGKNLSSLYNIALISGTDSLYARWKRENRLLGRRIELVTESGETLSGRVADLGICGELILEVSGENRIFHSGDISIRNSFSNLI